METSIVQARQGDTLITDEEFDLVIGELEQSAPENTPDPGTCFHVYCSL